MNKHISCAALLATLFTIGHAHAAAPVIYPAKGQGATQQDQDKYQCHGWAKQQSGFDPLAPAPAPTTTAVVPTSTSTTNAAAQQQAAAGGLVKSAAVGAAVGEVAHNDAGRGAAIGVLGGAALQGMKQRQAAQAQQQQAQAQQQQQQQAAKQQQAALAQQKATFDRAFGACMEARGYVVK